MIKFIKYSFVGGISAIVDIGIFFLCYQLLGIHLAICNILSFHFAITTNFFLGRFFVFTDKNKKKQKYYFLGVYLVSFSGMILNTAILFILINYLELFSLASKIFAALPVLAWNYLLRLFQKI